MHPVTLRDYSTVFPQYRHLIDGGVNDNLGVEALIETYAAQVQSGRLHKKDPYPHGAVFIIVDAHTDFDVELSGRSDVGIFESSKSAIGLTSTSLLNRVGSATLSDIILRYSPQEATAGELRQRIHELRTTGYVNMNDQFGHPVRVVYVSLSQVKDLKQLPFESFGRRVNSIATYFNISQQQTYNLYQAADLLIKQRFEQPLRALAEDEKTWRMDDNQIRKTNHIP
jgi:hypothetical protein